MSLKPKLIKQIDPEGLSGLIQTDGTYITGLSGTNGQIIQHNGSSWVAVNGILVPAGGADGKFLGHASGSPAWVDAPGGGFAAGDIIFSCADLSGEGFLEANGQVVSQSTYSDLYSAVGLINDVNSMANDDPWASVFQSGQRAYAFAKSSSGTIVVVGYAGYVATSTNGGQSWTSRSFASPYAGGTFNAVVWCEDWGLFVAIGNAIQTSPDGITWTHRQYSTYGLNGIAYSAARGRAVAVGGYGGYNYYSTNGTTWTLAISGSDSMNAVAYGDGKFVAVGNSGAIKTSVNGSSWTSYTGDHPTTGTGSIYGLIWSAEEQSFFAHVGTEIIRSPDGFNWSVWTDLGHTPATFGFAVGSGLLVCRASNQYDLLVFNLVEKGADPDQITSTTGGGSNPVYTLWYDGEGGWLAGADQYIHYCKASASYSTGSQFAVPNVPAPHSRLRAWIKT